MAVAEVGAEREVCDVAVGFLHFRFYYIKKRGSGD